jgi:hypothetical protein
MDDVGVAEQGEEHDLSVGALCVGGVAEGVEVFFEGVDVVGTFVVHFPDVAVGSTADLFEDVEFGEDVGFDLVAHNKIVRN